VYGVGYSPVYLGAYDGYYGGYGYADYSPPVAVPVEPREPLPAPAIAHWEDDGLRDLALGKFSMTRGLDPNDNKIVLEIVAKSYNDETGALTKTKFAVRWVEWKIKKSKDGTEIKEEKRRKTTVKLKFDELGRFTEYSD